MNVLNDVWSEFDKLYADKLEFKDIKLPVKFRDIHKIERNNSKLLR